jgi:hypothetical protein
MKPKWVANAFQPSPQGGTDTGVAKIAGDGSKVEWATYLGGSDYDSIEASIDVDPAGFVYVGTQTRSQDIPTTPEAFDRTHNGGVDWYVAKLSPDGSRLVYGTFIGDEGDNWLNTHNLVVDEQGHCYSSTCARSDQFPTTPGAHQRHYGGGLLDWGIVKLGPRGELLAGTLLGGNGGDNPDGIRIDRGGNLVSFGHTTSPDFPVTGGAWQRRHGGRRDAVVAVLSEDLSELRYASFFGGDRVQDGRAGCVGPQGSLVVAGAAQGGWPLQSPFQATLRGPADAAVAKFTVVAGQKSTE